MIKPRPESRLALILAAAFLISPVARAAGLGQQYTITEHGQRRAFVVAADELQVVGRRRTERIPPAADADGLLKRADALSRALGREVRLVMYPQGSARTAFTRRILTPDVLLHLQPGADPEALAQAYGAKVTRMFSYLPDHYILTTSGPGEALPLAEALRGRSGVISAEPQLAVLARKKMQPDDTFFGWQWHLNNTGQNGAAPGIDVNVTNVWDTFRGTNIYIAIVDDGMQYAHPDLASNSDTNIDYDFNDNDPDPAPDPNNWDFHGTAVAGVAAACGNNAMGVCGAAYEARLVGLRLIAHPETDADDAAAMSHSNSIIHIKNNSWGPPDCDFGGIVLEAAGPLMQAAIADGAANGRGGKGVIYTWAGGNGRECGEDINYDGYANQILVFAVGAVGDQGEQAIYSEPGACLVVVAPSSDGQGIATTDLMGTDGYNSNGAGDLPDTDYTETFGGTSSAAPLAAGVIALVLQANPNLSYRDVKEILLRSSTKVQPADADWTTNSAGIAHNHKFGAGLINARAAVDLATNWACLGPVTNISLLQTNLGISIPDNDPLGVMQSFVFSNLDFRVEHVTLTMTAPHQNWGNLAVTLTSPSGMQSRLAEVHGSSDTTYQYDGWTFTSVRHWGEKANGSWTVTVADSVPGDTGTLEALELKLYGTTPKAALTLATTNQDARLNLRVAAPGWKYAIERSTNLTWWTALTTQAIPSTGQVTFTHYNALLASRRFYRARLLP